MKPDNSYGSTYSSFNSSSSSCENDNSIYFNSSPVNHTKNRHQGRTVIITTSIRVKTNNNQSASDAYHTALQAFMARRRNPDDPGYIVSPVSTETTNGLDYLSKYNNDNDKHNDGNLVNCVIPIGGVPHTQLSEIFDISWVKGTEDRYIELIYAEWQNTKISLRRHVHRECRDAVKNDIKILSEIRHPNVLLLMATTQTVDHNLIGIFEPVDCTLYHFIHDQSERLSIQSIAKSIGNLADALKYAHMRGYVHSAISSHCVFLTSSGIVKLGGWELAIDIKKQHAEAKKYERRLRAEIYKWQAPELFSGHKATVATDVYGLTLLMWELCTENIPWSNLTRDDVEKNYIQLKQRITVNTFNFPSLLNNLLEAGLQLDVKKRTLDMMKFARLLQRLEMQYEDKDPIYVDQQSMMNITDSQNNTRLSYNSTDLTISRDVTSETLPCFSSNSYCGNVNVSPLQSDLSLKKKIEPRKLFPKKSSNNNVDNKNTIITESSSQQLPAHINDRNTAELIQPVSMQNQLEKIEENPDSETSESTDKPRLDIKTLKQLLAHRRRIFFSGNNRRLSYDSYLDSSDITRHDLSQVKSPDCEQHKPTSHKTNIEPKSSSSPGQHSTFSKSQRKVATSNSPYAFVPLPVRNAVVQPQVLNTTSQSFFESSLWSKERSICLSKSRCEDSEIDNNNKSTSSNSDKTFTVRNSPMDHIREDEQQLPPINDLSPELAISTIPRSQSLQALRDSLERATNLVKLNTASMTPRQTSTIKRSSIALVPETVLPPISPVTNVDDDSKSPRESVFAELYELKDAGDADNIKSIERTDGGNFFTVVSKESLDAAINDEYFKECTKYKYIIPNDNRYNYNDNVNSNDGKPSPTLVELKTALECGRPIARRTDAHKFITETRIEHKLPTTKVMVDDDDDRNLDFLNFKRKMDRKDYVTYSEVILTRRRSLPPSLGELRVEPVKLSAKGVTLQDNTVEDMYIDDEFDENGLAPNMILLDKNSTIDSHEMYPDLNEDY